MRSFCASVSCICDVMFYDVMFSTEGKSIPTELQEEAVELRKTMRFDDSERQGENYYLLACSLPSSVIGACAY